MITSDRFLWQILAIMGLNFIEYKLNNIEKFVRLIFMVGFMSTVFHFAASCFFLIPKKLYKETIAAFLIFLCSRLMWYFAYFQKKDISEVVMEIYRQRERHIGSKKILFYVIMYLTVNIVVIPCFICILYQTKTNMKIKSLANFTFGYEIHSEVWKRNFLC